MAGQNSNFPQLGRREALLGASLAALLTRHPALADAPAPFRPDREAMIPVTGGRVYVRINGDLAKTGSALPVVFVHGGPGSNHLGFLNALVLAQDRPVILYDQLDSGLSDHPGDPRNWTVNRFTDELEMIRAALNIPRWHVCGHSWGGTVALEYGARQPAALAGLVLGSPLVSTQSWLEDAAVLRAALPAGPRDTLTACQSPKPPAATRCDAATDVFYQHYLLRKPASAAVTAYRAAHGGLKMNRNLYETMWGNSEFVSTGTLQHYDGTRLLKRLDGKRTLFMIGQYDEVRLPTAERFVSMVPGSSLSVIANAGHGKFNDSPAESASVLRGWLSQQDHA